MTRNARRQRGPMLGSGLSAFWVVAFLLTGASQGLKDLLISAGLTSPWLLVGVYVALFVIGYMLLAMPLAWYSSYILPHRYALSTQTPRGWLIDQIKTLALGLVFAILIAQVIYALLRSQPSTWWIWAAAFLVGFSVLMGYLAPLVLVPLFYKLVPLEDDALVGRIRDLGQRTGVRIADVYTIDLSSRTKTANALFMGLGKTRRIALGDTLYAHYATDEIETIVAHELGHQVYRDLEWGTLVQSILMVVSLYLAHRCLHWGVRRFGFEGPDDIAALPLMLLVVGLLSLLTLPLVNAFSRWRESRADRFAVVATQNPNAFKRALIRLANQNLADIDPPRWVVWLFYSHPPISARMKLVGYDEPSLQGISEA